MPVARPRRLAAVLTVAALAAVSAVLLVPLRSAEAATVPSGLHVSGNQLLTGSGTPIVLRGVNRSGTEYQCTQNAGPFDGPNTDESIAAMAAWHINAVRVPLNEDCWLGINGEPNAGYSATDYRAAIADYVNRLHAAGLVAILDLHWAAPGTIPADKYHEQVQMADADHSPTFWTSVASMFKTDSSTVFDLFNEPFGFTDWGCWRDGGDCGVGYQVAGMQSLVDTVRATGATNPVLVGGLAFANDLSQWLAYRPTDSTGNLMASWHSYNVNACNTVDCWNAQIAPVAAAVPLVTGEVGEKDCAHVYLDAVLPWLDAHGAGYLGWGWDPFDCAMFPALISSYDGTPTAFGIGLRDHLAGLPGPTSSPTTTPPTSTPPTTTSPTSSPTASPTTTRPRATIAVTPSSNASQAPYFWEDRVDLNPTASITALTVTIKVPATTGIAYNDQFTTAPNGAMTTSHKTARGMIVYTATLNPGQSLPAGYALRVAAQYTGTGTGHDTSTDTFQVVATVGGKRFTSSGHF